MKTKALTSLFAVALALVACNKNETEPAFTPELKLDKTEKISAPADGSSVNLKVTANVSWTATSNDETVATVAPASKEITDKKSAETPVTVTISENETTEARTATLTFKAEGCKDIVVEIEQAASDIPDSFEVADEEGNPVGTDPIELLDLGGTNMLYVNSNIDWTATSSDATWLTVEPSTFTAESREVEPTAVTVTATANPSTTDDRTGTITFTAEGQTPVVVSYTQKAYIPLTVELGLVLPSEYLGSPHPSYPDWSTLIFIMENPSAKIVDAYYGLYSPEDWAEELADWDNKKDEIIAELKLAAAMEEGYQATAEELDGLNGVEGADPCIWPFGGAEPEYALDPDTEYLQLACFEDETGKTYVGKNICKTAAKPEPPVVPEDLLGNWICPSATEYWEEDVFTNWTMVLSTGDLGVKMEHFDAGIDKLAADNGGLPVNIPEATWDGEAKTLTVAKGTQTGLMAGNGNIAWIGVNGGNVCDIVFNVDLTGYTLSLGVDKYQTQDQKYAWTAFLAPLVFYKEGHVPAAAKAVMYGGISQYQSSSTMTKAKKDVKLSATKFTVKKATLR